MSADEDNLSEEQLINRELFSTQSITSQSDSKKEPTLTDQVKDLIRKKLDGGFQVTDKQSRILLQKTVIDELKLIGGWRGKVRQYITEILKEKNIAISNLGLDADKVGDMTVNLIKTETTPEIKSEKKNEPDQKPKGALPIGWKNPQSSSITETEQLEQQSTEPEIKYMSETAQQRLISKGLNDFLVPLYLSFGIVEPDEEEKEDEAKLPTAKAFRKNVETFSQELNEYLVENDIKLPAFLNHLSIIASIGILFVMPVVKWKFFSSKQTPKPKYDETVDLSKVKV